MTTNTDITLYHEGTDPETRMEVWERVYFPSASCQNDTKVTVTDAGLKSADVIKIRIPTDEFIKIASGDKIFIGKSTDEAPPNDTKMVIGFADNRRGTKALWHWKVICA